MKIRVVSVGKPKDAAIAGLHDRYAERIRRFGAAYDSSFVPDVTTGGRYSEDQVRERESRALLEACGDSKVRIALDRTGTLWTSEEIAARLERWSERGVAFLIGGPFGHDRSLRERSEATWSLSPLTLPHELVRVIVAEQLYRALTMRRGTPYHK